MKSGPKVPIRVAAATLALTAAVALTGCGAGSPGVAATVNGTTISESAVDDIAHVLQTLRESTPQAPAQSVPRADIVGQLVIRPAVLDAARQAGDLVEPAAVRYAYAQRLADPSDATVELLQVLTITGQLKPAQIEKVVQDLSRADIELSPRYGTFDPARGIVQAQPNWIGGTSPDTGAPAGPDQR